MFFKHAKSLISWRTSSGTSGTARGYKQLVDVQPEVREALQRGRPVVALESTIITHGMPFPQNLETAREVEDLVRHQGATPATCALVDGRIKVGLAAPDLLKLASKRQAEVVKCSRRDLAFVASRGQSGGTTVAATMIIAHMVGVRVFATGGIGGVHREGHVSMDVSADLVELGRTPVAVVCSGVKSILDIPRTLEYLETQGVCVATYGDAAGRFPDFYTRDSGCRVPYNLQGPAEAASLIRTLHELKLQSGILIGVPIPAEYAVDKQAITRAIEEAQREATRQNITGKQVTPFLLAAIAQLTKGTSLHANMALIKHNASVAAQIARELCGDKSFTSEAPAAALSTPPDVPPAAAGGAPLIVGASILDLSLTLIDEMPAKLDGATYHTVAKQSAGGVGRNIAEGIFKLHGKVQFISVVGDDELGKSLLQLIPQPLRAGVQIDAQRATSLCSVIFDKTGDCKWILGNMEIHASITPHQLRANEQQLRSAPLVIMDGNLSLPTMECLLGLARQHRRPVFFEPTDMRIAGKPFQLPRDLAQQIRFISPNIHELKTIVETITQQPVPWEVNVHAETTQSIVAKSAELLAQVQHHFDCILLTLSHHGVLLSLRTDGGELGDQVLFDQRTGAYLMPAAAAGGDHQQRFYAAPTVERVINVSGAGDSFCSGFITSLLRGHDVERCVSMGFLAAERSLKSESAVPSRYFVDEHDQLESLESTVKRLKKLNI